MIARTLSLFVSALALAACSGTVVQGDDGAGGESAATTGSGPAVTSVGVTSNDAVSVTSGDPPPPPPLPCADSSDCGNPGEQVCVFSLGTCAQRCGPASPPCPPGTVCVDCATGSCPGCRDCVSACLPLD